MYLLVWNLRSIPIADSVQVIGPLLKLEWVCSSPFMFKIPGAKHCLLSSRHEYPRVVLFLDRFDFRNDYDTTICTLESLINVQQNLINFWQFSFLHALIPSYTFINFWENYLPTRLFHPTWLLKLNFLCRSALEICTFFSCFPQSLSWFFLFFLDFPGKI